MRTIITMIAFAMLLVPPASAGERIPLELEFGWSPGDDVETNLTRQENLSSLNALFGWGMREVLYHGGSETTMWGRTLELVAQDVFSSVLNIYGHGYAQGRAALENGATNVSVGIGLTWRRRVVQVRPHIRNNPAKAKISAAGVTWSNIAAERVIPSLLGKEFSVAGNTWLIKSQWDVFQYIFITNDSARDYYALGSYSYYDIDNWIRFTCSDIVTTERLHDDVKNGVLWHGLGLLLPTWHVMKYGFTGSMPVMPDWWINPQAEFTDAGLLYTADGYWLLDSGIMVNARIGLGRDRVQDDHMHAAELGVYGISLPLGLNGGARAGISDTLERNHNFGASLSKSFGRYALSIKASRYSGYHRRNPRASGSFNEVILDMKIVL